MFKGVNNNEYGKYNIDDISNYSVVKSPYRLFKIHIQSSLYDATFKIGKYNNMVMIPRGTEQKIIMTTYGEDTVGKMIHNILETNSKPKLERL